MDTSKKLKVFLTTRPVAVVAMFVASVAAALYLLSDGVLLVVHAIHILSANHADESRAALVTQKLVSYAVWALFDAGMLVGSGLALLHKKSFSRGVNIVAWVLLGFLIGKVRGHLVMALVGPLLVLYSPSVRDYFRHPTSGLASGTDTPT